MDKGVKSSQAAYPGTDTDDIITEDIGNKKPDLKKIAELIKYLQEEFQLQVSLN